jgi:hypothetical protein
MCLLLLPLSAEALANDWVAIPIEEEIARLRPPAKVGHIIEA